MITGPPARRVIRSAGTAAVRRRITAQAFLAPALLVTLGLVAYPLYLVVEISFRDVGFARLLQPFLDTLRSLVVYRRVLDSPDFWQAARISVVYTVISTSCALLLGTVLALVLNRNFPGRTLARILVLLPWPIPSATAALMWLWLFEANYGFVNHLLLRLGLIGAPVQWLVLPGPATFAVIVVTVWKVYPFYTLMMLAGLQAIPHELYESAQIDGASDLDQFRHITWPALQPVIGLALILQTLWIFSHVDIIRVMTNGGPFRSTETLPLHLYLEAFQYFNISSAAVVGVMMLIGSILFILVILPRMSREFY